MMASRFLAAPRPAVTPRGWRGRLAVLVDGLFTGLDQAYRDLLYGVLRHRVLTVVVAAAILGASLLLLPWMGSEFLPPSDEGEVRVTGKMEIGTRLDLVDQQTRRMEEIVYRAVPERVSSVAYVVATRGNPNAASQGQIRLSLTPASQRTRSDDAPPCVSQSLDHTPTANRRY